MAKRTFQWPKNVPRFKGCSWFIKKRCSFSKALIATLKMGIFSTLCSVHSGDLPNVKARALFTSYYDITPSNSLLPWNIFSDAILHYWSTSQLTKWGDFLSMATDANNRWNWMTGQYFRQDVLFNHIQKSRAVWKISIFFNPIKIWYFVPSISSQQCWVFWHSGTATVT